MSTMGSSLCAAALLAFLVFSLSLFVNSWHFRVHKGIFTNGTIEDGFVMDRNGLVRELNERRKEILPFLISSGLRGHCEDSVGAGGITAILEQGFPLQMIQLLQSPWEERFRVCLGLVRLLHYLSHSPLGSVALLDFQPRQFVMVSGELKLTDLDDASVTEPACQMDQDCILQFPLRNFSLLCSAQGVCEGLNEMRNLYNAYRYFFTYLLPHQAPPALRHLVDHIMNSTGELKGDVNDTLEAFEDMFHLYKSGLHLDNMPSSIIRDYAVMKGMSTSGNMEYRCWPSYNHQGCMLSVHSDKEAAFICNSLPQCTSFSLSDQRTWTGRLLASFQSGFSHLVTDGNSEVYLKKTKASPGTTV
uniref:extracellular tyrosine-protein kinase PKDCC-like n=1 Tax=Oncorhynchus gorbuscha TaxID=8017 RepID=UPI001EAEC093|nr:extracellular tyrosine-protein kinase PKDCC-like [Oncorhynchus gorbuscha]